MVPAHAWAAAADLEPLRFPGGLLRQRRAPGGGEAGRGAAGAGGAAAVGVCAAGSPRPQGGGTGRDGGGASNVEPQRGVALTSKTSSSSLRIAPENAKGGFPHKTMVFGSMLCRSIRLVKVGQGGWDVGWAIGR